MGLALTFMLALAACSGDTSEADAVITTTVPAAPSDTTTLPEPTTTITTIAPMAGVPADFTRTVIEIDGLPYNVAVADTPDQVTRGLMFVEDLNPLDGMLFVYDRERLISHWMKNTLIPLDIAFFDTDGWLVSKTTMVPCTPEEADADDCTLYPADGPAAFSVEVPAGGFDDLPSDARLVIIGSLEGSGKEI